jgi:hypothetical protein
VREQGESLRDTLKLQHELLDSINVEQQGAPTFATCLNAHGMYETTRFVLRLSPRNHELMAMIEANAFELGDIPSEAIQDHSEAISSMRLSTDSTFADKVICRYPIQRSRSADLPIDSECVFASNGIHKAVGDISRFRIL